jgi:hypothetical protein
MRLARRAAVVLALALPLAACGGGPGPPPEPTARGSLGVVTAADARALVAALCRVAALAGTDPGEAGRTFRDRAHDELHVLAAAVEPVDRAAAAALLVAKERVEADLSTGAGGFAAHAAELVRATRGALRAVGLPAPGCEGGTPAA